MKLLAVTLLATALSGCGFRIQLTTWAAKPLVEGVMESLMSETDVAFARAAMESQLKLLEGLLISKPDDLELLILAVKGFAGYAMLFLEEDDPRRASGFYRRAARYGMRCLSLKEKRFRNDDLPFGEFSKAVEKLNSGRIEEAYWTAIAWAGWINLNRGTPAAIADFPRVIKLMEWVMGVDRHYFYSGALWFFGSYYTSIPPILGGDPQKSRLYFEEADSADGSRFLWGRVLFAEYYAVQTLDRDLFVNILESVAAGEVDEPRELKLLNTAARKKARMLLDKQDELF